MNQIGTVVKAFCDNNQRKLKGFNINDAIVDEECNEKRDLFAILMYCRPELIKANKYISKLIAKIKQQTNETVCV